MAEIHDLLKAKGKKGVLDTGMDRALVEAAAILPIAMKIRVSVSHIRAGPSAHYPIRSLPTMPIGRLRQRKFFLWLNPACAGSTIPPELEHVGVPYGSHARLILLYLQTEALRTQSREVELGGSLRDWLGRLNISYGGKTGRSVRDQAERISRCRLTFHLATGGAGTASGLVQQNIVDRAHFHRRT